MGADICDIKFGAFLVVVFFMGLNACYVFTPLFLICKTDYLFDSKTRYLLTPDSLHPQPSGSGRLIVLDVSDFFPPSAIGLELYLWTCLADPWLFITWRETYSLWQLILCLTIFPCTIKRSTNICSWALSSTLSSNHTHCSNLLPLTCKPPFLDPIDQLWIR